MSNLLICPCGKIPDELHIIDGMCCKYAFVSGGCCGEWNIEFRTNYKEIGSDECMKLATKAWNEAERSQARSNA